MQKRELSIAFHRQVEIGANTYLESSDRAQTVHSQDKDGQGGQAGKDTMFGVCGNYPLMRLVFQHCKVLGMSRGRENVLQEQKYEWNRKTQQDDQVALTLDHLAINIQKVKLSLCWAYRKHI